MLASKTTSNPDPGAALVADGLFLAASGVF